MLGGQVSVRGEKVVVNVCLILISLVTKCALTDDRTVATGAEPGPGRVRDGTKT